MTTPLARARETLDEIETLVAHLEDALGSELRLQSVSEDSAVRDAVAALPGRGEIEAWLTPAILKLAAHLLRVATLVALEADGVVPPRARDGGRALIDQVSRPGPQRPALFADHPALRWCLRLRADRLLIPAREELLACLAGLSLDVIPSLRAGLLALEPHLDGRIPPPDTPEVRAAALRHRNHLAALDQAACEVRALAPTLGATSASSAPSPAAGSTSIRTWTSWCWARKATLG